MKIEKTGWYLEGEKGGDYEFIATDADEMVEYLEGTGELNDMVTNYICDNFDMEDFISSNMQGGQYMTREDMIEDFKSHEIIEGEDFNNYGYDWYEWFEEGQETDEEED